MAHKNTSNWSPYKARQKTRPPVNNQRPPIARDERGRRKEPNENFSFNEADDRFRDFFDNHGFEDYPHPKRQQLTRFYFALMSAQKHTNLTRLVTLREVALKHFVDSLMVTKLTKIAFPLLDMGTGPGFPGIPLRIHFDEGQILLGEGIQRRVDFLKSVRDELGLKELDVLGRNITDECFYPVQTVITRAVEDARNTLTNVKHSLQVGGRVILMKGPNCEPEIEMALKTLGNHYRLADDISYELPSTDNKRRLLIFEKTKAFALPDFEEQDLAWERALGDIKSKKK